MAEAGEEHKELDATLTSIETVLDVDRMRREVAQLEQQAAVPDLWDDPVSAQRITSRLSRVQAEIARVEGLRRRLDDVAVLYELADSEDDVATRTEADAELAVLRKSIGELEVRTLMSGEYDERD